jgi:hypothetical protein
MFGNQRHAQEASGTTAAFINVEPRAFTFFSSADKR